MIKTKRIKAVVVVVLLLTSNALVCSWSWWENIVKSPIQSITQSIDSDTVKKMLPLAALASVVGFYFWISKKNTKNNVSDPAELNTSPVIQRSSVSSFEWKPQGAGLYDEFTTEKPAQAVAFVPVVPTQPLLEVEKEPSLEERNSAEELLRQPQIFSSHRFGSQQNTLTQYEVYSQANYDGGGAASCGYHALLRAMQIVAAKANNKSEDDLKRMLMDKSFIYTYFRDSKIDNKNDFGEWRQYIVNNRTKEKLRNVLHDKFMSQLKSEKADPKAQSFYRSAVGDLEKKIAEKWVDDVLVQSNLESESSQKLGLLPFTDDIIKTHIRSSLERYKDEQNEQEIKDLQSSSTMQDNLSVSGMQKEVGFQQKIDLTSLLQSIRQDPLFQERLKGDWLTEGEVDSLWVYEREKFNGLLDKKVMCYCAAIPNLDLLGMEGFDGVTPFIKKTLQKLSKEEGNKFIIFILGQGMRESDNYQTTSGHWYGLVMEENTYQEKRYYTIDSLARSNNNRMNDGSVHKIIKTIEGLSSKKDSTWDAQ